jgi:hypothetical protein
VVVDGLGGVEEGNNELCFCGARDNWDRWMITVGGYLLFATGYIRGRIYYL